MKAFSGGLVLFLALGLNLVRVLELKAWVDRECILNEISERALRAGQLRADELCYGTFGFAAWHLFNWYAAHEGRRSPQLDGFTGYIRPAAIEVGQHYSRSLRRWPLFNHTAPLDRHGLLALGGGRVWWWYEAKFFLLRSQTPMVLARTTLPADFIDEPFPLDEAEWRHLIERR